MTQCVREYTCMRAPPMHCAPCLWAESAMRVRTCTRPKIGMPEHSHASRHDHGGTNRQEGACKKAHARRRRVHHLAAVSRNECARVRRLEGVDKESQCHQPRRRRDFVLQDQMHFPEKTGGQSHFHLNRAPPASKECKKKGRSSPEKKRRTEEAGEITTGEQKWGGEGGRAYSGASSNGSDGGKDVRVHAPAKVLCRKHVGDEHPVSCQVAALSVATFRACSLCLLAHLRDTTQGRNMAETRANLNAWKLANVSEKGD